MIRIERSILYGLQIRTGCKPLVLGQVDITFQNMETFSKWVQ